MVIDSMALIDTVVCQLYVANVYSGKVQCLLKPMGELCYFLDIMGRILQLCILMGGGQPQKGQILVGLGFRVLNSKCEE